MVSEGQFPKVDGDILYASEANRFARAGGFIGVIPTQPVGSSTTGIAFGSMIIGAGSLPTNCILDVVGVTDELGFIHNLVFQFSGTAFGQNFTLGSFAGNSNTQYTQMSALLGPSGGTARITTASTASNNFMYNAQTRQASYPASGLVVIGRIRHVDNTGSVSVPNCTVTFNRGLL